MNFLCGPLMLDLELNGHPPATPIFTRAVCLSTECIAPGCGHIKQTPLQPHHGLMTLSPRIRLGLKRPRTRASIGRTSFERRVKLMWRCARLTADEDTVQTAAGRAPRVSIARFFWGATCSSSEALTYIPG